MGGRAPSAKRDKPQIRRGSPAVPPAARADPAVVGEGLVPPASQVKSEKGYCGVRPALRLSKFKIALKTSA